MSDEDGNLEDMPDLIPLPPGPVLEYYDNDERPRAQYKYRELAEYQPIIPVRIPRRDVVRTELRPYILDLILSLRICIGQRVPYVRIC